MFKPLFKILFSITALALTQCAVSFPSSPVPPSSPYESSATSVNENSDLQIYVVDVGQGDATLILGPEKNGERASLLIDAGRLDPDGGAILQNLLQTLEQTQLDATILTHFDGDHIGGFVTAYQSTSMLWSSDCTPSEYFPKKLMIDLGTTDKTTDSALEYIQCRDANRTLLQTGHVVVGPQNQNMGYSIDLGGGYRAQIVTGNGYVVGRPERIENVDTENERSLAVLVSGPNDFAFLVMGDVTGQSFGSEDAPVEQALAAALKARGVQVQILRVGHHGSATSSSLEFLQSLNPKTSLISVGPNRYGHPDCATLADIVALSGQVLQTGAGDLDLCPELAPLVTVGGTWRIQVTDQNFALENFSF